MLLNNKISCFIKYTIVKKSLQNQIFVNYILYFGSNTEHLDIFHACTLITCSKKKAKENIENDKNAKESLKESQEKVGVPSNFFFMYILFPPSKLSEKRYYENSIDAPSCPLV